MKNFEKILVKPEIEIKNGLRQMDENGEKILFVISHENKLDGSVTDGDIRRWILKGESLGEPIAQVMNRSPIVLQTGYSFHEAKRLMLSSMVEYLPVIDDNGKITDVLRWTEIFDKTFKKYPEISIPVVIMAGGKGSRLSPLTKILPKGLIPIGEKPLLEHIIGRFEEFGCNKFLISLNYKGNMIKSYFGDLEHSYSIDFIEEENQLGTAGSLSLLKERLHSTFFLSNCDILIDADYSDILEYHMKNCNKITIVASVKHYKIPYGICRIAQGGTLEKLVEKPEYEFLVNTGFYIIEPDVIAQVPENTKFDMTELIEKHIEKGAKVGTYPISERSWIDTGQIEELEDVFKGFNAP